MLFYEKLSFLMTITQVTNRMLSRELQVDPSLISRLRRGSRGIPHNRGHIKTMAHYFSRRCITEYQCQALSETLGIKLTFTMDKEQLSDILYYWLCGETDAEGNFMRTIESLSIESADTSAEPCRLSTDNSVYYSNEGKRASARAVYLHLLSLETPSSIFIFTDEADSWLTEDAGFTAQLQSWGMELIKRGFRIYQIMPPSSWADQAYESFFRWIPLYMTGQVSAYYYPRMRDNIHRRTLIAVPGEIAITSSSVAASGSYVTLLTTDWRLTQVYASQFQDLLSLCQPLLDVHASVDALMQCLTRFISSDGARIQQLMSLSLETAPSEVLEYCLQRTGEANLRIIGQMCQYEMKCIEEKTAEYGLIDIVRLADADAVRKGNVPIAFYFRGKNDPVYYYTPELYILHLQNILRLLETCGNYHFIPLPDTVPDDRCLMVRERQSALLLHMSDAFTVFEISQPDIALFCGEYLLRIAERAEYTGIGREKIISRIKELIRELQQ